MRNIRAKILPELLNKRLILVLDNHRGHKGSDQVELMEQFCEPHFIPPYSSELNGPIESCWSVLKKRVFYKFTKL